MYVCMVKTITISDDVYEKLLIIKGSKSFSEILRELLKDKIDLWIERFFGIGYEEDKKIKKYLKESEKLWKKEISALIQV